MTRPERRYVDTNVVLPAFRSERDTALLPQLAQQAHDHGIPLVTSTLTRIEIQRILFRDGLQVDSVLDTVFKGFDVVGFTDEIGELAAYLPVRFLKTLDAIHLATAIMANCDTVITRDRQLISACAELGIATSF